MQTVNLKLVINEQKINETINYDQKTLLSDNLFAPSKSIRINRLDYSNYVRIVLLFIENIKTLTISNTNGLECVVTDPAEPILSFELKPHYTNSSMLELAKLYRTNQFDNIDLNLMLASDIFNDPHLLVCLPKLQYLYLFAIDNTYTVIEELLERGFKLDKAVLHNLLINKPNRQVFQRHRSLFFDEFAYAYIFINQRAILNPIIIPDLILLFYMTLLKGRHYESYKIAELVYAMIRKGYLQFDPEIYDQNDVYPTLLQQYNNYIDLLADVLVEAKLTPDYMDEIFTDVDEGVPSILNVNKNTFINAVEFGIELNQFEINYPTQFYIHQIIKYYRSSLEGLFDVQRKEDELHSWLWDDSIVKFIGTYSKALTEIDYGEIKKDIFNK